MAANAPIIRQLAWISVIPQMMVLGMLVYIFYVYKISNPFIFGPATYLILSFGLKTLVPKEQIKGMKLLKEQQFENAILFFEKSVDFFTKNAWIDKFRYVTLLSSSKPSYREMGLCNIAFCYSQTKNGKKAKEYYEMILKEFSIEFIKLSAALAIPLSGTKEIPLFILKLPALS